MRDAKGRFSKDRPFKVGDRVRVLLHANFTNRRGDSGEVVSDDGDPDDQAPYTVRFNDGGHEGGFRGSELEPAPQPKAEPRRVDVDLLIAERDGLLAMRAEHEAEIATLKAEVERLNARVKVLGQSEELAKLTAASACRRSDEAEAKLEDLAALLRAMNLLAQTPGEEPSFQDAMRHVLGIA